MTSSSADGVRNVVADPVGIGAVGHCNEQVVGLYKFDFVDCEAAVQSYGGYCAELTSVGHALLSRMIEIGLIEFFKTGIDYEGRQADFYFLLGQSPLSK